MLTLRPPLPGFLFDVGRWGIEAGLRASLPPENPEILRFCAGSTWRLTAQLKRRRWAMVVDEMRRCFGVNGRTAETLAREAHDVTLQSRLETLIAPRITDFGPYLRIFGDFPEGSLLLHPSVASAPLLHAALAARYPGVVVFRARGLPPEKGKGPLRDSWINRQSAKERMEEEERLAIVWESDPTTLEGHLRRGARVIAAFDDRAFRNWRSLSFLGRPARLSPEPWEAAQRAGAFVIPAFILRERDKTHRASLEKGMMPEMEPFLRSMAEPWLRQNPGTYGMWLAECRIRKGLDDHPLFGDYG